jgi:hypothetical protein
VAACFECHADTQCEKEEAAPSILRRGHDFLSISLGKRYFIVLQYPRAKAANFQAVFEKHASTLLKAVRSVIGIESLKEAHITTQQEGARVKQQFSQFFHPAVAQRILEGS